MRKYKEVLETLNLRPYKYHIKGKVAIIDTDKDLLVIKEKNNKQNYKIFDYLSSRGFNYFPEIIKVTDEFLVSEYVEDIEIPKEQKLIDLIELLALLHSKTTHHKEVDIDDYKHLFEDISNNIEYLNSYYTDMITLIENEVYMSPSSYLIARNISKILASLNFCKNELDSWYSLIKEKRKQRVVVLHNNLDLSHFIKNNKPYLINWEKSIIDNPIFDLYKLYKRLSLEVDFSDLFIKYEQSYPLLEEEKKLFFILISLPNKINLIDSEYKNTINVSELVDYLYKTEQFLSPYYSEKTE